MLFETSCINKLDKQYKLNGQMCIVHMSASGIYRDCNGILIVVHTLDSK